MEEKLKDLQSRILSHVSCEAKDGNVDKVAWLSSKATRVNELLVALNEIEETTCAIEAELDGQDIAISKGIQVPRDFDRREKPQGNSKLNEWRRNRKRAPTGIEIKIDWSKNGFPGGEEVIRQYFASDTLVKLFQRLVERFGPKILEAASNIQINRGNFVSRNPDRDYANPSTGKSYQHQRIPGTEYSVLTHSETDQKVEDVTELLRKLRLSPGSFSVKKVLRS